MSSLANIAVISNDCSESSGGGKSSSSIVIVPDKRHIHIAIRTNFQLDRISEAIN